MKLFSSNDWKGLKEFQKLDIEKKRIVFYAENKASINHFRELINELTYVRKKEICYVTSVENDPFCNEVNENISYFFIGNGIARTKFFLTLNSKVLILDMPDLERFHIKRSKTYNVHYIYIFHSMFSTHTYLRHGALDDFDTIFCVGPYQINEILKTEKMYNLKSKKLVEYGFGRLDFLLKNREENKMNPKKIIISPSYGENNLLKTCGVEIIEKLLELNFTVILRPHFKTIKEDGKLIDKILKKFDQDEHFIYKEGVIPTKDLEETKILISDWSGISIEFAFVYERPIIFIDVPQKIQNKNFNSIEMEPFEISIRNQIGRVVKMDEIENLDKILSELNSNFKSNNIISIRDKSIFNIKKSYTVGADYIESIIDKIE